MSRKHLAALAAIGLALTAVSGCSRTEKYPPREMGGALTVGMLTEPAYGHSREAVPAAAPVR